MVNKKAVSLMVSYVILVSIAIGLSIGVYAWLKDYTNLSSKVDCKEGTSLFLEDYELSAGLINLSLKNNGYFNISGFIASYSNESGRTPIDLLNATGAGTEGFSLGHYYFDPALKPGEIEDAVFNRDNISVIQIQPFILDEKGNKIMCEQAVMKQNIYEYFDILSLPGFVSWWKFDEDTTDSFGNNHGTFYPAGEENYVSGKSGNALDFDGMDDYVDAGNDGSIGSNLGDGDFTVGAWIKTTQTTAGTVVDKYIGSWVGWYFRTNLVAGKISFATATDASNYRRVDSTATVNDGNWSHVVAVKSGSTTEIYVDGVAGSTVGGSAGTISDVDSATNLRIGTRPPGSGSFFNGTIDEVMIFNTALSAQNISDIYDSYG